MNGIIFVELVEHLEAQLGIEAVDELITACELPSGGAYTSVGDYPDEELLTLVDAVSKRLQVAIPDLLEQVGEHLFVRLLRRYPQFAEGVSDPLHFLERVGERIHRRVVVLYPTSLPPRISTTLRADGTMTMRYESRRAMWRLAVGLVRGCGRHFDTEFEITSKLIEPDGTVVDLEIAPR